MEVVDDGNTSRITYQGNWTVSNVSGAGDGSVHTSSDGSSAVVLEFVGSSIELDAVKSPNGANFTVKLDGSSYGPYSLYAGTTSVGPVWSQSQLNPTATHTLTVQRVQPSMAADSLWELNVDAFRIAAAASSSAPASTPSSTTPASTASSTTRSSSQSTSTSSVPPSSAPASPQPTSIPDGVPAPSQSTDPSAPDRRPSEPSPSPPPSSSPVPSPVDTSPVTLADDEPPNASPTSVMPSFDQPADPSTYNLAPRPSSSTISSSSRSLSNSTTTPSSSLQRTLPLPTPESSTTPAAASSPDASNISSSDNRVGIILGSIVAVIIFLCLITIPIVYFKRKHASKQVYQLKSSTMPAYSTTTTKGLPLMGVYKRNSANSPTAVRNFGFGSQSNQGHQAPGSVAATQDHSGTSHSPHRPTSFEDQEGRSRYLLYPDTAYAGDHRRTDSISSDYPYPLTYNMHR